MLSLKKHIEYQVRPGSYTHELKAIINDPDIVINIERVHVPKLITSCTRNLASLKDIILCRNYNWDMENHFYSDPYLIKSVVSHLLSNAVQFRDSKKLSHLVNIDISDKGRGLTIDIIDNGIGIKKEIKNRVFDKFFVGNENSSGFGIGLYRVKTIVDRLNGSLTIDSAENIGTHCRVDIPNSLLS